MEETKTPTRRGRPRKKDLEDRDSTADLILRAALDHFSTRGFDATSTVSVATKAGVVQSVLHYHFKTKELLWQATIRDLVTRINKQFPLEIDISDDADIEDMLKRLIRRHMKVASVFPEMARIVIIEGSFDTERLAWLTEHYLRATFRNFGRVLEAAHKRGIIRDSPDYLMTNIIYSAGSVLFSISPMIRSTYGIDINNQHQRDLAVELVLDMIMNGIRSRPE